MKLRIEIYPRKHLFGKRWYFRVRAGNNETIAQSEGYRNRGDCHHTAQLLRNKLGEAEIFGAVK
jgi:uncharacterized protein YegP (UPF0339 family)